MTPSPIAKVLSIFRKHRVRALLMGGQACILYGAAEFSRDIDLAVLATDSNLARLKTALGELEAEPVFVPPLRKDSLLRGHASHFRAQIPEASGLRIDLMSVMHGCDSFEDLWARRTIIALPGSGPIAILALPDLVKAKKTQRDKDWPMVRRLIESDYYAHRSKPTQKTARFWLTEARTPSILIELAKKFPRLAAQIAKDRQAVAWAIEDNSQRLEEALREEEDTFRALDKAYWQPLRAELAKWWRGRRSSR